MLVSLAFPNGNWHIPQHGDVFNVENAVAAVGVEAVRNLFLIVGSYPSRIGVSAVIVKYLEIRLVAARGHNKFTLQSGTEIIHRQVYSRDFVTRHKYLVYAVNTLQLIDVSVYIFHFRRLDGVERHGFEVKSIVERSVGNLHECGGQHKLLQAALKSKSLVSYVLHALGYDKFFQA